jgi:hypothetical protein
LGATVGYLYWFKDLIADPGALLRLLKSGGAISYELRRNLDRTAGLASLASLSLSFTVLVCHRLWVSQRGSLPAGLRLLAWVIGLFTVFRVFAWAERLALIEIGIVFALYWVAYAPGGRAPFVMRTRGFFPLAAVTVVVVLFAIGEYYRAWESYSAREASYWNFIFQRLLNYYAQALNSGAGMLTVLEWPTYTFQQTLDWLHKFPILLGPIFRYLMQVEPNLFLERFADPEFNNLSGLFILLYEMGIPATLVVCALLGLVAQSTYRAFKDQGNVFGLLYPLMFMTIIEFLRIWYIGNSRAFLLVLSLVLAILLARREPAAASVRGGMPPPVSPFTRIAR